MTCIDIKKILIISFVLLSLDFLWLGTIAYKRWNNLVLNLTGKPVTLTPKWGGMAYICMIFGVYFFTIPIIEKSVREQGMKNGLLTGALYGALFGFILYGVFDYTNLAILPIKNTIDINTCLIDILWGTILMSLSTVISYLIFYSL